MSRKMHWTAIAFVACVALLWPTSANAHALLSSTDPQADQVVAESPDSVTAIFSEPVEVAFGALRVHDTNAERVDTGEASHPGGDPEAVTVDLESDLPEGTYTVTYRVISSDAHPIEGAFVFHVGRAGERSEGIGETLLAGEGGSGRFEQVLFGVVRWVLFSALIVLGGAFFFLVLVWFRSRSKQRTADEADDRVFIGLWRKLVIGAWWGALVATLCGFILQGAVAADVSTANALAPDVAGELLQTRYGLVAAIRLGILLLMAGAWIIASRAEANREIWPLRQGSTVGAAATEQPLPRWMTLGGIVFFSVLAATPGLSGHAGATSPVWLNVPMDALHVIAASVWIGGLVTLVMAAFRAYSAANAGPKVEVLGPVIARFSDVAMVAVAVLVLTGIYRTWVEVGAWRAFVEAPYGWVLLTKIGVFLPLLAMGAINNRVLKPRIKKAVNLPESDGSGMNTLRKVVRAEIALGVVVLALTALLVNLPPAKVEAGVSGPFLADVALGSDNLNVLIDPNEAGENNIIHLTATTPQGSPAAIKGMRVRFRMPEEDIGPLIARGQELAPGHFAVQGRELSIPGTWILAVEARIDKFTNTHAEVEVIVNP